MLIGDVERAQGDLAAALDQYRRASSAINALAKARSRPMPNGSAISRSPHNKVGDVLSATRETCPGRSQPIATASPSAERLAKSDPGNADLAA